MLVNNQPMEFTQKTLKGEVKYNGPEWIKTFETIANLTRDGVLAPGSGALGVDAAYQLFNQGKAAMLYTGSWSLPALTTGMPAGGGWTCTSPACRWWKMLRRRSRSSLSTRTLSPPPARTRRRRSGGWRTRRIRRSTLS